LRTHRAGSLCATACAPHLAHDSHSARSAQRRAGPRQATQTLPRPGPKTAPWRCCGRCCAGCCARSAPGRSSRSLRRTPARHAGRPSELRRRARGRAAEARGGARRRARRSRRRARSCRFSYSRTARAHRCLPSTLVDFRILFSHEHALAPHHACVMQGWAAAVAHTRPSAPSWPPRCAADLILPYACAGPHSAAPLARPADICCCA